MVSSGRAVGIALRAMFVPRPNRIAECRSYASGTTIPEQCRKHRLSFGNAVSGAAVQLLKHLSPASGVRRLWVSVPVQMGRRACKIAARKGAQAAKKMKAHQRIGKLISKAVRDGGPNPTSNIALASLLQHAKEHNFPKDIIEKKLKKGNDKDSQEYMECTYEAYGFGGVGLVMEVLTDNANRANSSVRDIVKRCGAKMADPGSVMFGFKRTGVVAVKVSQISSDDLLLAAMDAGAEDVREPETYEDEDPSEEKYYKVVMPVEQYADVKTKLREAGIPVDADNSGLELLPLATVEPDDEAVELNKNLVEKLLELDDVDAVYTSQK